jgi:hypothetical protein
MSLTSSYYYSFYSTLHTTNERKMTSRERKRERERDRERICDLCKQQVFIRERTPEREPRQQRVETLRGARARLSYRLGFLSTLWWEKVDWRGMGIRKK